MNEWTCIIPKTIRGRFYQEYQVPLLHGDTTNAILRGYYHVYNTLGFGFLEKVYENALAATLRNYGLFVSQQVPIEVCFEGTVVGTYFADLVIAHRVVVEVKAVETLCQAHEAQTLNYLKATGIEVGMLLNFGSQQPEFRRLVFTNDRKRLKASFKDPS